MNWNHSTLDLLGTTTPYHDPVAVPGTPRLHHPASSPPDHPPPPPPKDDRPRATRTEVQALLHQTNSMRIEYQETIQRRLELLGELIRLNERQAPATAYYNELAALRDRVKQMQTMAEHLRERQNQLHDDVLRLEHQQAELREQIDDSRKKPKKTAPDEDEDEAGEKDVDAEEVPSHSRSGFQHGVSESYDSDIPLGYWETEEERREQRFEEILAKETRRPG
ncbi:hypothetical protein B0A55_03371 [Friedmanniomyces simplex]|uniref:Uncharacterized protein n=1 Tax=Friedmanniomyces simplex TaxID=329884 RepID=A0A4U0XSJ2_9PEZI|nr:hypothetical protein B0A55_03371 [Friedmanniomyces simplex]